MDVSLRSKSFKDKRQRHLIRALSSLRREDKADLTLLCGDQKFPVHKLILQASSPYFVNMFEKGGAEIAKTGTISFNSMEPETLEAILDFIYLGSVETITTEDQVRKVSVAANLMQLVQLVFYCCDALVNKVRKDNYVALWDIASKCNHSELKEKVLTYASDTFDEVYATGDFLSLTEKHMIEFFNFAKGKVSVLDRMVDCALKWLMQDPDDRGNSADELLACFDAKFVSKTFMASVLKDDEIMDSCESIANSINKLAVGVFLFDCIQHEEGASIKRQRCAVKESFAGIVLNVADGVENGIRYLKMNYQDHWEVIRKVLFVSFLLFVFVSVCSLGFKGVLLWIMGFVGGGMVFRQEILAAKLETNRHDNGLKII